MGDLETVVLRVETLLHQSVVVVVDQSNQGWTVVVAAVAVVKD